jgi:hypothetical protein
VITQGHDLTMSHLVTLLSAMYLILLKYILLDVIELNSTSGCATKFEPYTF